MPSAFENRFAASLDRLYSSFAVTAVYTAPNGVATSGIGVRVHRNEQRQVARDTKVTGESQSGEIFVKQSDLAKPVKNGRFTLESGVEVWSIETTPILKNGQYACTCVRSSTERMMEKRAKNA